MVAGPRREISGEKLEESLTMANPQLEDGYTSIANESMDALMRTNFSPYERRVLDCVLRKTYGWHKKRDRISYSQFEEDTHIDRRHIGRAIISLKQRNIVTVTGTGYALEYSFQKDYTLWDLTPKEAIVSTKNLTPVQGGLTPVQVSKSLPIEVLQKKERYLQKILTKEKEPTSLKDIFFSFKNDNRYRDIDFDNEFKKFCEYWLDGKRKLKNEKLACHNWLDSAVRFQKQIGGNDAVNKRPSTRDIPTHYTTPEELALKNEEWPSNV